MVDKSHHLYFPISVKPKDYLSQFLKSQYLNSRLSKKSNDYIALRLIACVSFMYVATHRTSNGKIKISSTSFRDLLGEHSSCFVNFVCTVGVPPMFQFGQSYKVGERSTEYVRNKDFEATFKPCSDFAPAAIDKLFRAYSTKREAEEPQYAFPVPALKAIAARITVDRTNYREALQKYVQRKTSSNEQYNLSKAEMLFEIVAAGPSHHGYFFYRENSRLYSSLTSCPREFRSLFRFNGKPFVELDQCASQPFLLLGLYSDDSTTNAKREAAEYHSLWDVDRNNGDFYANLMPNFNPADRSIVKSCFIKDYLNRAEYMQITNDPTRKEYRELFDQVFRSRFPILHREINKLKTVRRQEIEIDGNGVHKQFAVTMQQMESKVFIDRIAVECVERKLPIYTVHDCIGCLEEHKELVTTIAVKHLTEFCGFEPRFK